MKNNNLQETTVNTCEVFKGKILHVFNDTVELPNKTAATREHVKHNGGVCIVAIDDDENVLVVKQFRYPFKSILTELPAGKLDSINEDPLSAAKRELKEETGALAENFEYLGKIYTTPALMNEIIHMYLATGLVFEEQCLDEDEFLTVERIPLDTLANMIMNGEIKDSKTVAAVLKVYARKLLK